ncbi:endonuclease 4 [Methanimicrococcus sp. At1]|uniref:Endonuclease 4 n=1 Tax=Methanimicrococcus hacksteinii TaxID=3028293 RepID=A0ABU3VQV6_9EURY|nr:sugar phosphate isomerase/epimerase family protein [Methanimicrococcus sp. At1]MDV0445792.1 endonuclease 4 [Methanimicrococcus sp. At1]
MKFGVSSFAGPLSELEGLADSIELYIPKMDLYKGRELQTDKLDAFFDSFFSYDFYCTAHAPYYPDPEGEHPKNLAIDTAKMTDSDFQLMFEALDISAHAGADVLVVHPGRITEGGASKSFGRMIQNLKTLAEYAEEVGVVIGLENKEYTDPLNLCCKAEELAKAVDLVDSDYLGATLDIGHANLTCGGNQKKLAEFVKTISPLVVHVHVHDNHGVDTGRYGGDEHYAPGQGIIDYSALRGLGDYDETFNFEVFSIEEFKEGKTFFKNKLSEFWNIY